MSEKNKAIELANIIEDRKKNGQFTRPSDMVDAIKELRRLAGVEAKLRELEGQEVIGYLFQHEETGLQQVVERQQVEWGFEQNNPRWQKICAVYAQPVPAAQPSNKQAETGIPLWRLQLVSGLVRDALHLANHAASVSATAADELIYYDARDTALSAFNALLDGAPTDKQSDGELVDEREAFEAWWINKSTPHRVKPAQFNDGDYRSPSAQNSWEAYQQGRADQRAALAQPAEQREQVSADHVEQPLTMVSADELPPLPEFGIFVTENFGLGDWSQHEGFTADQMHAYARAAVAAQEAKSMVNQNL